MGCRTSSSYTSQENCRCWLDCAPVQVIVYALAVMVKAVAVVTSRSC